MVKTAPKLREVIHKFCAELGDMDIHCERVLLFGSYSKGLAHADSDIDLVIVSSDWERYNLRERLEILGMAAMSLLEPIQAYGVTPEEIETHQLSPFWEYILDEEAVLVA